ncbi:DinB family protein [Streptomyces sp. NPDC049577]|uniref:DinB family protein n=1 Tax=Streptomyces sp. NPDC049577 TaxID=3155153 RepID=UPI003424C5F8
MTHDADERTELLRALAGQRETFLITLRGVTDDRARERTTVSELTLGGLVNHLTHGERNWTHIMTSGDGSTPESMWDMDQYAMPEGATLDGLVAAYRDAARATDAAVAALPDLDVTVPLPEAPWAPGDVQHWSARRILLHLLRELAQHAGHADILREALDGANTTAQLG